MEARTQRLWDEQNRHPGDRWRLFSAVAAVVDARAVLYPGSWIDVAASFVFDDVTYVDMDRRAARFFSDPAGVAEIIATHRTRPVPAVWQFHAADYTSPLPLEHSSVDLLVSLYAGFVSEACSQYLRPGGTLLVNPSHGDAAMAALDERYDLVGVVNARSGAYTVSDKNLAGYLQPKRDVEVTKELLRDTGRGVAYTKSPFAYLFRHLG